MSFNFFVGAALARAQCGAIAANSSSKPKNRYTTGKGGGGLFRAFNAIALKNPTRGAFVLPAPLVIIILIVIVIVSPGIPITIMSTITIREDGGALPLSEKQKQGFSSQSQRHK